ncbi:MAG TPA: hypothetical protein VHP34_00205 [Alphaproteobacteria bacterium]|nr:hypothetical protein [Alphaproteobacteria bacterium]
MKAPVIYRTKTLYLVCFVMIALLFAAPAAVWAAEADAEAAPPPARKVQTDRKLPHGFYFDEAAQQYKKHERIVVPVETKTGETRNKRVIRTTCYNLQHETDKSRVFRPVACNN